jgi:Fe-S cluster assembly iron-binding protein IscA
MIHITPAARTRLQELLVEHPEDPIVRITVKDLDEARLVFSITLESAAQPDDYIQDIEDLTIAIEAGAAPRMQDITLDYLPLEGFRFLHPHGPPQEESLLGPISLN